MHTLADLIAFNNAHCTQELVYYGQEIFEMAQQTSGYPTNPMYVAARTHARRAARAGIDNAIRSQNLDVIVAPHLTNSTGPAVAGYPNLSLPVGIRDSGRPAGMLMHSTFLREPRLIGFGFDLEQELNVRRQPQFNGFVKPIPNANLCTGQARQPQVFTGRANAPLHGRIF
jgi:amidase